VLKCCLCASLDVIGVVASDDGREAGAALGQEEVVDVVVRERGGPRSVRIPERALLDHGLD
jgi:hypothetical protein